MLILTNLKRMGYTDHTWKILKPHLKTGMSVCDFGAQNDFSIASHPYTRETYAKMGITDYRSLDVSGKGGSVYFDLGIVQDIGQFDLVVDAGTKEHVLSLDRAFRNQYKMTKTGGLMYCENPKVGNWPEHGHHYFTMDFYYQYARDKHMHLLVLEEHAASNNVTDGWEIICLMKKL